MLSTGLGKRKCPSIQLKGDGVSSISIQNWPRDFVQKVLAVCMFFSFCVHARIDTTFFSTFFQKVGYLVWDAEIDSLIISLRELGIDTCVVKKLNNPISVGPSVSCELGDISLGIGYHWGKDGVPEIAFFVIHFPDCAACSRSFAYLTMLGYAKLLNAEPIEVETLFRYFTKDSRDTVRIDVWNECCPGNRIKIFRVVHKPFERQD